MLDAVTRDLPFRVAGGYMRNRPTKTASKRPCDHGALRWHRTESSPSLAATAGLGWKREALTACSLSSWITTPSASDLRYRSSSLVQVRDRWRSSLLWSHVNPRTSSDSIAGDLSRIYNASSQLAMDLLGAIDAVAAHTGSAPQVRSSTHVAVLRLPGDKEVRLRHGSWFRRAARRFGKLQKRGLKKTEQKNL